MAPWPVACRERGHNERGDSERGHSKRSHNLCAAASAVAPPRLPLKHFSRHCRYRALAAVAMFAALSRSPRRCGHSERGHGEYRHRECDNRERTKSVAMVSEATQLLLSVEDLAARPRQARRRHAPSPLSARERPRQRVALVRRRGPLLAVSAATTSAATTSEATLSKATTSAPQRLLLRRHACRCNISAGTVATVLSPPSPFSPGCRARRGAAAMASATTRRAQAQGA